MGCMTTKTFDRCYCGEPRKDAYVKNIVAGGGGRKGNVANVGFCRQGHSDMYDLNGDVLALFEGGCFKLKGAGASVRTEGIDTDAGPDLAAERRMIEACSGIGFSRRSSLW